MDQNSNVDKSIKQFIDLCNICNKSFRYTEKDIWFDEKSCGYSVKLVRCPHCKEVKILKYYECIDLDVNNDERFYEYNK